MYRKLRVEKKWKIFFSLCTSVVCPKKNLSKFLIIVKNKLEAFPTKSFFKNVPTIFCSWVARGLSKTEHSNFIAHNSVKNHCVAIKNTDS